MKLKTLTLLASIILVPVTLESCGLSTADLKAIAKSTSGKDNYRDSETWGKVVTKSIDTKGADITTLTARGSIDIEISQGEQLKIEAHGNEKAIEAHDLDFSDNELTISRKSGNVFNNTPKITLHITTPHIQNIIMSGTSDIEFKTDYEIEAPFNITMSGTGDIDIKALKCESTDIKISGTGDLKAKKITSKTSADILVSGTGDINASIKANSISAKVSGVGDADLDVDCNNLFASASGVGDMELKGKCINYKKHESGKSSIDSRGLTYKEKK